MENKQDLKHTKTPPKPRKLIKRLLISSAIILAVGAAFTGAFFGSVGFIANKNKTVDRAQAVAAAQEYFDSRRAELAGEELTYISDVEHNLEIEFDLSKSYLVYEVEFCSAASMKRTVVAVNASTGEAWLKRIKYPS